MRRHTTPLVVLLLFGARSSTGSPDFGMRAFLAAMEDEEMDGKVELFEDDTPENGAGGAVAMDDVDDVENLVIIGQGPAGLSVSVRSGAVSVYPLAWLSGADSAVCVTVLRRLQAAIYASRANLRCVGSLPKREWPQSFGGRSALRRQTHTHTYPQPATLAIARGSTPAPHFATSPPKRTGLW